MTALEIGSVASPVPRVPARRARPAFPRRLREVVARALPDDPAALALVRDFLVRGSADQIADRRSRSAGPPAQGEIAGRRSRIAAEPLDGWSSDPRSAICDPSFVARLIEIGRGSGGEAWTLRLLAARMLEWQILALAPGDAPAHRAIFEALGVDFDPREGFSASNEAGRIAQFRARLSRFAHLHAAIDGMSTAPWALDRFLRSSRQACRIPVARYLVSTDETIDRIYDGTRQSRGLRDRDCETPRATQQALAAFPPREARIAQVLAATHEIFWVGEQTPSEINSLIEYPLGTVALVVKPPGSDVEIEIKRAGIRGPRALDVIYARNGYVVCSSHHLQGAAVGKLLEWQTHAEARFATIWRIVHGREAPISRTLRVNSVFKMPLDGGGYANVIRYFTDPGLYGEGYAHMRGEMSRALDSLLQFEGHPPYEAPNDLALTARFFAAIKPGQAVQIGTSSFRLDQIARHLHADGASRYFADLGMANDRQQAFAFADEVLSEILVDYVAPDARSLTYAGYLKAAFAIPENRARADRNFVDCAQQIGTMFGTCVALCTGSGGESYVTRNVGLRSVFEDGAWKLRVIFVDHDALNVPEAYDRDVYPQVAARMMWFDYIHILGGRIDPARVRGTLALLAGIYRVSPAVRRAGLAAFHQGVAEAHRRTREAVPNELSSFFHARWIERLEDFDEAVRTFVKAGRATLAWRASIAPLLGARRQTTRSLVSQYIRGIGAFGRLWRKLPYLVDGGRGTGDVSENEPASQDPRNPSPVTRLPSTGLIKGA
jgi:hypothetical protein